MFQLRVADVDDYSSLMKFYKEHPSPFIETRKSGVLAQRVESGDVVILDSDLGLIAGATVTYPLIDGVFAEIGSTRSATILQFRVFEFLIAAQALLAATKPWPEKWPVADVDIDNPSVLKRLVSLGFEVTQPPEALVEENERLIEERRTEIVWTRCPAGSLSDLCDTIINAPRIVLLRGREKPKPVRLSIEEFVNRCGGMEFLYAVRASSAESQRQKNPEWGAMRQRLRGEYDRAGDK